MTKRTDRPEDTCCEGCFGMTWIPELDRRFILCNNPRSDHYGHVVDARHSCQDFGLQPPVDIDWLNQGMIEVKTNVDLARSEQEKLRGKVSQGAFNAIGRAYIGYHLTRPLEEVKDRDLYKIRGIGKKSLAEIRQVIPEGENGKKE